VRERLKKIAAGKFDNESLAAAELIEGRPAAPSTR